MFGDKFGNWVKMLAQDEFAYNNYVNRSTGEKHFEIVTRMKPREIFDLRDVIVGEEKRSAKGEVFAK